MIMATELTNIPSQIAGPSRIARRDARRNDRGDEHADVPEREHQPDHAGAVVELAHRVQQEHRHGHRGEEVRRRRAPGDQPQHAMAEHVAQTLVNLAAESPQPARGCGPSLDRRLLGLDAAEERGRCDEAHRVGGDRARRPDGLAREGRRAPGPRAARPTG